MTFQTLQKILPRLYSFLPYYLGVKAILPPAHVFFEVTYRCNLRCEMCHFLEIIEDTETNRKFKQELSAAKVRRVIDQLPRFSLITFTGGEAFMKSDILGILDHAAKRHKVHIITNGTLLTPKIIDFLVSRRVRYWVDPGIFYLGVSLEGFDEVHDRITGAPGSFAKSISGLERLLAARAGAGFPKVHVTCVIADENVD
ncbi:MAG: radical SAM protein, partial [Nitrospinaceae bacterium]